MTDIEFENDIAVVIPLFNGERWIGETIESIQRQQAVDVQIVVVDDGSTDSSCEAVRQFKSVVLCKNEGKGVSRARNVGLSKTTARFVAFVDQDDLLHPQHFELLLSELVGDHELPAVAGSPILFDSGMRPQFCVEARESDDFDPWSFFPCAALDTPSQVLIRRSSLDAIGGWNESLVGVADFYTWLRLSVDRPLRRLRAITVGRRIHDSSFSVELRKRESVEYFTRLLHAAQEAIRFSVRRNADGLEPVVEHMGLAVELLTSIKEGNRSDTRASAERLSKALAGQSHEYCARLLSQLLWFAEGDIDSDLRICAKVLQVYEEWPKDVALPAVRRSFRNAWLPMTGVIRFAAARPWSWRRLELMWDAIVLRFS